MLTPSSPHRTIHFAVDVDTRRAVVALSGTLTTAAVRAAAESVTSLPSAEGACVTLDLSAVTHVAPRALRLLESELDDIRRRGTSLRVKAESGSLARDVLRSECSLLDRDAHP